MSRRSYVSMKGRSLRKKQRSGSKFRCLRIEQLESRQMLASQILGTVWNDGNADGVQQAGEPGLQGWEVFLDSNNNQAHDEHIQTFTSSNPPVPITDLTTITSLSPPLASTGDAMTISASPARTAPVKIFRAMINTSLLNSPGR